jgi:phosphoglycolate phosphatase
MKYPAVIFDLDGTLLDTLDDIAFSMNAALREAGVPEHKPAEYRRLVGQGLDTLAYLSLPLERRDHRTVTQCVAAMRKVYAGRWNHSTRPYAGIPELLASLKKMGIRCAVCSNKAHDFTVKIVAWFFGDGVFETVLGGGKFPPKPDPGGALHIAAAMGIAARDIVYVGDSDVDMKTAVNAGMFPAGAAWGFRSREELLENGAKIIADTPEEIIVFLAGEEKHRIFHTADSGQSEQP